MYTKESEVVLFEIAIIMRSAWHKQHQYQPMLVWNKLINILENAMACSKITVCCVNGMSDNRVFIVKENSL